MRFSKLRGASIALLLIALILVVPSILPAHASIAYVGGAINSISSSSALTVSYTSASSNTVFVMFAYRCNAGAITVTITDSGSSTYSKQIEIQPDAFRCIDIYSTTAGGSVSSTLFTLTMSASSAFIVGDVAEYSGITTLGSTFSNTDWSGSTSLMTVTSTLSSSNDFAIAFVGSPDGCSGTPTAGTGNLRKAIDNAGNGCGAGIDNTGSSSVVTSANSVSAVRWGAVSVDAKVPPPPDFSLSSNAPANGLPIVDGQSNTIIVTATLIISTLTVTFSCVSPPSGITCLFSPTSCATTCTTTLTVTAGSTVNPAFYSLTIQGVNGGTTHTITVTLQVISTFDAAAIALAIVAIGLIIGLFFFLGAGKKRRKRR